MLVMLPGPPRELRPMFRDQALPIIQSHFPLAENFLCRTLKTTGLGESFLEEKIAPHSRISSPKVSNSVTALGRRG